MERRRPRRLVMRLLFLFSVLVLMPLAMTSVVFNLLGQRVLEDSGERIARAGKQHVLGASDQSLHHARREFARLERQVNDVNRRTLQDAGNKQITRNRAVLDRTTHRLIQQGQRVIRQSHQKQAQTFQRASHRMIAALQDVHGDTIRTAQTLMVERGVRAVSDYGSEVAALSAEVLENEALKVQEERTRQLASDVHHFINKAMGSLREIAALPEVQSLDAAQAQPALQRALSSHPHIQAIAILDKMGMEIVKFPVAPPAALRSHRDKPDYLWAVNGREYVSPVAAATSEPYVKMSVPIDDGNGAMGVVTANVALDALNQSLRQNQGSSAAAYVTNQNYEVVAHAEPQSVLTRISNEDLNVALPALKEEKQIAVNTDRAGGGEEIVRASARVTDKRIKGGWAVVVVQPKKDLLAEAREIVVRRLRDRAQKTAEDLKSQSLAHTEVALKKAIQQGNQIERATLAHARKSSERLTQSAVRQVHDEAQRLAARAEGQMQTNTQQEIASTNRHITQAAKSATAQAVSKLQSNARRSAEQAAAMMEDEVRQASRGAARTMSQSALALSLLFLLGALALAVATARGFVQPLSRLAEGARAIAHGDYARRVETTAPDVELVQLAEAFNTMAAAVERTRAQLESANRHLFEEKQKVDAIIARMPDGLIVTDAAGRVVVMNAAARRLLDLNEDETLFTEADWQSVVTEIPPPPEAAQRALHGKELCDASTVLSRSGRTIQVSVAPVADEDGGRLGCMRVLHDISQEREMQQLKTEFLSLVAHELRTPLVSILGFTGIMLSGKQGEITEAQAESLSIVQRQAERLASLINDLLDVSRIEAGRVPIEQEPVPVDEIAEGALEELRPPAREKGVKLRLNAPTTPCLARGDYQRLTQVFVNLIGNAIKFTPAGGRVVVTVTPQKKNVLVEILDTGIGIPKDEVGRVFDKFYQVRRSAERKTNGTGLGLAIVKGIIEAHGGRIWLHSEEGRGTQFYFTLPTAV